MKYFILYNDRYMRREINVRILIVTAVLLVISGCASSTRQFGPDYVSPLEYRNYSCLQLGAELSAIVRWSMGKEEKTLKLLSNEVRLIGQFAKEHNCRDLIQLFDKAEEDARNEPGRRNKAFSMLRCLRMLQPYRQPHWFVVTVVACTLLVGTLD